MSHLITGLIINPSTVSESASLSEHVWTCQSEPLNQLRPAPPCLLTSPPDLSRGRQRPARRDNHSSSLLAEQQQSQERLGVPMEAEERTTGRFLETSVRAKLPCWICLSGNTSKQGRLVLNRQHQGNVPPTCPDIC